VVRAFILFSIIFRIGRYCAIEKQLGQNNKNYFSSSLAGGETMARSAMSANGLSQMAVITGIMTGEMNVDILREPLLLTAESHFWRQKSQSQKTVVSKKCRISSYGSNFFFSPQSQPRSCFKLVTTPVTVAWVSGSIKRENKQKWGVQVFLPHTVCIMCCVCCV
jgi:hypothetical protein